MRLRSILLIEAAEFVCLRSRGKGEIAMSVTTNTVSINPAFLQEIKDDSREVRQLFAHAVATMDVLRLERVALRTVAELLARLRDQLAMHFTLEEAFGYFDDPVDIAPHLLERAEVLRSDHALLFLDVCQIVDQAEGLAACKPELRQLERLAADFRSFCDRFQGHETRENALILEAFDDDIGVGD